MTDLGHHFRALHFQSLAQENQDLRRRVAKLTEIQGYVQLLVDKLEKAQRRQQLLSGQNALLRQQARQLQIKFSQSESMHGDQMRYVFAQHDQLVEEKNRSLAHMKSQLDQQQARAAHTESQLKAQRSNMQRAIDQYEQTLSKLVGSNKELQTDLQMLYQNHEQQKMKFYAEKENWAAETVRIRAIIQEKSITVNDLGKQIEQMDNFLQVSQLQVKKLTDYNKQLEISFQKRQAQTSQTINRLQQGLNMLRMELQRSNNQNLSLRATKSGLEKELQEMKVIQVHMRNDNQTYITDNQRLIFLLEEADKENAFLRDKQRELEEYSSAEGDSARTENLRLREEINVLSKNNSERQGYLGTKLLQLKETLNARNSLQLQLRQAQSQFHVISQELRLLQDAHIQEKAHSTEVELSLKSALEEATKAKQNLITAEQVSQKIQQQNFELSSQNHTLSRQISNPREMSKEYREQVDRMLKNFHDEREEQNRRHWLQKQKLRQVYEYELKEKQLQFARQISQIEQQIARGRRLESVVRTGAKGK